MAKTEGSEISNREKTPGNDGPFPALRIRNFRLLLTGTTLSAAANWMQQVVTNWLAYDLTGSGTILGSVNLARSAAMFGLMPFTGVLIDRTKRRTLMLFTNLWLLAVTFGLGMTLLLGPAHVSYLFLLAFLCGIATSVDSSLRQVVVFDLFPRELTPNAVALIQTGWSLMRSFGPAVGGFIMLWFGDSGNFFLQAGAYAFITFNILWIRFPPQRTNIITGSPFHNIKEGFKYIAGEPVTRTFMLMGLILPFLIIPIFNIIPPIYAKDVYHGGPELLGFMMSAVGIGGIIGGVLTASLSRIERRGLLQLSSIFLVSLSLMGFAFCTNMWLAFPFLVLSGFFEIIFLTSNQTLLQLSIPDNMRGRVTSIVNLNATLSPFGGLLVGVGSDYLGGPRTISVVMCSLAAGIAVCIFLFSPTVRGYRISRAIAFQPGKSTATEKP